MGIVISLAVATTAAGFAHWLSPPIFGAAAYMAASTEARGQLGNMSERYANLTSPIRAAGGLSARGIRSVEDADRRLAAVREVKAARDRLESDFRGFRSEVEGCFRRHAVPLWRCDVWVNLYSGHGGRWLGKYQRLLRSDKDLFDRFEEYAFLLRREFGHWHFQDDRLLWDDYSAVDRADQIADEISEITQSQARILDALEGNGKP
ncbi:MAG: hypothetical protein ACREJO_09150 [Phycisphaerales bacterium]